MEADANDINGEPPCCRPCRPRRSGAVPTLADAIGGGATTVGGGSFGNKEKILEGNPICLRLFAVLVAITHLQSTK
jgi:hypothetical protein